MQDTVHAKGTGVSHDDEEIEDDEGFGSPFYDEDGPCKVCKGEGLVPCPRCHGAYFYLEHGVKTECLVCCDYPGFIQCIPCALRNYEEPGSWFDDYDDQVDDEPLVIPEREHEHTVTRTERQMIDGKLVETTTTVKTTTVISRILE